MPSDREISRMLRQASTEQWRVTDREELAKRLQQEAREYLESRGWHEPQDEMTASKAAIIMAGFAAEREHKVRRETIAICIEQLYREFANWNEQGEAAKALIAAQNRLRALGE